MIGKTAWVYEEIDKLYRKPFHQAEMKAGGDVENQENIQNEGELSPFKKKFKKHSNVFSCNTSLDL